jgi:hypothetical protein
MRGLRSRIKNLASVVCSGEKYAAPDSGSLIIGSRRGLLCLIGSGVDACDLRRSQLSWVFSRGRHRAVVALTIAPGGRLATSRGATVPEAGV